MHSVADSQPRTAATDASLIARIETLRESVRGHKQRAIAMWNACIPAELLPDTRVAQGKFTQQLVQCD